MGLIEVNGIRVFAYHGCLPEEARIGGHYRVDVAVEGDFARAEASDDLHDTVDYGRVTTLVKEQMAVRSKLIEHVGRRILGALKAEWPGALRWQVRVVKEHPPVPGAVDHVAYVLEGDTGEPLVARTDPPIFAPPFLGSIALVTWPRG